MFSGIVVKTTGSGHWVRRDDGSIIHCTLKGNFRIKGIRTTNPVAVGDRVEGSLGETDQTGVISKLIPRKNYIIRKATKLSHESHILAANVDQAVVMITIKLPETLSMFIDRLLVSAEAYRIPVILLFNKVDLYTEKDLDELAIWLDAYDLAGYAFHIISLTKPSGLEELQPIFKDKVSVLVGNSGVGKSTLINHLNPEAELRTSDISDYHKSGKHTTTFPEMVRIESGGFVIDTPGIRSFGMLDIEKDELYHFFPELFKYSSECQFHNCTHTHEPGCAIRTQVEAGKISGMRYANYLMMMEETGEKYRQGY